MVTFEQVVTTVAGLSALGVVGMGAWGLRTLYSTVQLVAKIQANVSAHAELHDHHETRHEKLAEKHGALEVRLARIEVSGCSVRGQCAPARQG